MTRLLLLLTLVGCGSPIQPDTLPADAVPFGTVDMWEQVGAGRWTLKASSLDNEPFPVPRDCGSPCDAGGLTKIIEHWSGPAMLWSDCSGGFQSEEGNLFMIPCQERPQVTSFDYFVGPTQTHHITIWREPGSDSVHWIIRGLDVTPPPADRVTPDERPSPRG